jgi:hypothetical protein
LGVHGEIGDSHAGLLTLPADLLNVPVEVEDPGIEVPKVSMGGLNDPAEV